jgi:putative transcriptional regulator
LTLMSSRVDNARMKLSNRVRERRQVAGLTQEQLASAVFVSRQTVIAIEKGEYTPSALLALSLARFFGVPFEDVFDFCDEGD